jgi:hypothetical protein
MEGKRSTPAVRRAEQADEAGAPAFLATSNARNVPLYQRHDFVVEDEYEVGPVVVWSMLRPSARVVAA